MTPYLWRVSIKSKNKDSSEFFSSDRKSNWSSSCHRRLHIFPFLDFFQIQFWKWKRLFTPSPLSTVCSVSIRVNPNRVKPVNQIRTETRWSWLLISKQPLFVSGMPTFERYSFCKIKNTFSVFLIFSNHLWKKINVERICLAINCQRRW